MSAGPTIVQGEAPGVGHIYAPAGEGRHPALMLLHGSEGRLGWLGHRDAAIFAAHGYLAAPFGYCVGGNHWIGGDICSVALDATEAAMAALRAHPRCDGRLGVYGWSRGGEHALLATGLMAEAGSPHLPDAVAARPGRRRLAQLFLSPPRDRRSDPAAAGLGLRRDPPRRRPLRLDLARPPRA